MPIPTVKQLAQTPHGRTLAGMAGAPLDASGGLAYSLRFNGSSSHVDVANAASLNMTAGITVALWVNVSAFQAVSPFISGLLTKSATGTQAYILRFGDASLANNKVQWIINGSKLAGTVVHAIGTWYLIVGTYDGTSSRLYDNGVLDTTIAASAAISTTAETLFFGEDSGARWLNGLIAAPRIWNRALSAVEIAALYTNNVVPTNGLVAEWLFAEGSGTTALDTSGNGNNGALVNAVYAANGPF